MAKFGKNTKWSIGLDPHASTVCGDLTMSSILPFFDEPDNKNRQRIVKEAKAWTTFHCPDDGTNLRYSPGDTETNCTHCGQRLSLVAVKWSGQH